MSIRLENRIKITVSDQGPGIPPEFQERLFQKFSQADSSDTRSKGGTGLGLNISRTLVEKMGGRIGDMLLNGKPIEPGKTYKVELDEGKAFVRLDTFATKGKKRIVVTYLGNRKVRGGGRPIFQAGRKVLDQCVVKFE